MYHEEKGGLTDWFEDRASGCSGCATSLATTILLPPYPKETRRYYRLKQPVNRRLHGCTQQRKARFKKKKGKETTAREDEKRTSLLT
jgi:hypothetical protein